MALRIIGAVGQHSFGLPASGLYWIKYLDAAVRRPDATATGGQVWRRLR